MPQAIQPAADLASGELKDNRAAPCPACGIHRRRPGCTFGATEEHARRVRSQARSERSDWATCEMAIQPDSAIDRN